MFGHKDKDKEHSASTISNYIDKKSRLMKKKNRMIRSIINHAIHGHHKHYFSKQDVLLQKEDAQCKVCKMSLADFRVQKKIENWTPHLKPIHKTDTASDDQIIS